MDICDLFVVSYDSGSFIVIVLHLFIPIESEERKGRVIG
jgi:hypothetical protein